MDLLAAMATFVRVVEGKSLSSAARALRLSLPAVSRQLRALEEDLGATLVVRSTRRLHVTEAGSELYRRAVRLLRDADEARATMRSRTGVAGTLVVSASIAFGSTILVPRLPRLLAAHPDLTIELRLEDHFASLVGDGVDLAIRAGSPPPDSTAYVAHPLSTMTRIVVASPRYTKRAKALRKPSDVTRHPCLLQVTTRGAEIGWVLARGDHTELPPVTSRFRSHAPSAIRDVAIGGAGLAYLPDALVAGALAEGSLVRVLPEWSGPPLGTWAVYRAELRGSARVRAFLAALPRDFGAFTDRDEGAMSYPKKGKS